MSWILNKNDVRKILQEELAPIKTALGTLSAKTETISKNTDKILMNTAELKAGLDAATAQVTKIQTEQTGRFNTQSALIEAQTAEIKRLTDLLNAGGEVSPEVMASLAALQTNLDAFDATIPDPAPPAPENPA